MTYSLADVRHCLAVRRYEKVPNPRHHILQLDNYRQAMAQIKRQVENPHEGVTQDLYLMTQCRHFILSNSSLHWWAAWLNRSADKTVIVPARGWPNSDMLPDSWTSIS